MSPRRLSVADLNNRLAVGSPPENGANANELQISLATVRDDNEAALNHIRNESKHGRPTVPHIAGPKLPQKLNPHRNPLAAHKDGEFIKDRLAAKVLGMRLGLGSWSGSGSGSGSEDSGTPTDTTDTFDPWASGPSASSLDAVPPALPTASSALPTTPDVIVVPEVGPCPYTPDTIDPWAASAPTSAITSLSSLAAAVIAAARAARPSTPDVSYGPDALRSLQPRPLAASENARAAALLSHLTPGPPTSLDAWEPTTSSAEPAPACTSPGPALTAGSATPTSPGFQDPLGACDADSSGTGEEAAVPPRPSPIGTKWAAPTEWGGPEFLNQSNWSAPDSWANGPEYGYSDWGPPDSWGVDGTPAPPETPSPIITPYPLPMPYEIPPLPQWSKDRHPSIPFPDAPDSPVLDPEDVEAQYPKTAAQKLAEETRRAGAAAAATKGGDLIPAAGGRKLTAKALREFDTLYALGEVRKILKGECTEVTRQIQAFRVGLLNADHPEDAEAAPTEFDEHDLLSHSIPNQPDIDVPTAASQHSVIAVQSSNFYNCPAAVAALSNLEELQQRYDMSPANDYEVANAVARASSPAMTDAMLRPESSRSRPNAPAKAKHAILGQSFSVVRTWLRLWDALRARYGTARPSGHSIDLPNLAMPVAHAEQAAPSAVHPSASFMGATLATPAPVSTASVASSIAAPVATPVPASAASSASSITLRAPDVAAASAVPFHVAHIMTGTPSRAALAAASSASLQPPVASRRKKTKARVPKNNHSRSQADRLPGGMLRRRAPPPPIRPKSTDLEILNPQQVGHEKKKKWGLCWLQHLKKVGSNKSRDSNDDGAKA